MRILLTGASGLIGCHTAARLAARGAEVRGFSRGEPPPEACLADWFRGDIADADAVRRAAAGCGAIVHAAALYTYSRGGAAAMERVNVAGTRNVVEVAARQRIRLLATSSSATCGPARGRPATEADGPPSWELAIPYKRTKMAAERLILDAARRGIDALCVNPTTVLGPLDRRPTPSGRIIQNLVEGRIAGYVQGAGINVVAAEDVGEGHALALERGRAGQRYILGGEDLWLRDAFAVAAREAGVSPPRLGLPWRVPYLAARLTDAILRPLGREPRLLVLDEVRLARLPLFFSSEKARRELGYRPRPAADALCAAVRWFARAPA
jgi:dihydroflavonol-4-reductase